MSGPGPKNQRKGVQPGMLAVQLVVANPGMSGTAIIEVSVIGTAMAGGDAVNPVKLVISENCRSPSPVSLKKTEKSVRPVRTVWACSSNGVAPAALGPANRTVSTKKPPISLDARMVCPQS